MKTPFTGGCVCGAVRYRCTAAPEEIQMFKCHCRDCQRLSGGPYAPVVFVPENTFTFTQGGVRTYATQGEAMTPHIRGFCTECGSRLTGGQTTGSTHIGVTASSLDEPGEFVPAVEVWVADAQPWDHLDPKLPRFKKYPK